jgi:peptidylprolyl isomerase
VVIALLTLAGCVSRVGPAVVPAISPLPVDSPVAGECDATDIQVTGTPAERPVVTLPTGCAPPTMLLARDLTVGTGKQAVVGADLEVGYVMITWFDGSVLDSTWAGDDSLPLPMTDLGNARWINGWGEGVLGMREGGRRLLVVPPESDRDEAGETVVYVVDAVRVR